MKKYNFYSGPAMLPPTVLEQASKAVLELDNIGMSLIEISHRSKEFVAVLEEAQALVKEFMGLGDEYKVLFLQGGATMQFCMVPLNLLNSNPKAKASYLDIGSWSKKAIKEAKMYGDVHIAASSAADNYSHIPHHWDVPSDSAYIHITTNETIHGTQIHHVHDVHVPLIADMSSDIFSRPRAWNKYDLIYAGAQKNIGPSGATLVVIKESLLDRLKVSHPIPTILDYRNHIKDGSLHNTPSTFAIYTCMLTLRWIKSMGGLDAMAIRNKEKADTLYAEIDRNPMFMPVAAPDSRSEMNVCWVAKNPEIEEKFANYAKENDCIGIKGHRSVGGFRASIYNAMPMEGVQVLIDVMQRFAEIHG